MLPKPPRRYTLRPGHVDPSLNVIYWLFLGCLVADAAVILWLCLLLLHFAFGQNSTATVVGHYVAHDKNGVSCRLLWKYPGGTGQTSVSNTRYEHIRDGDPFPIRQLDLGFVSHVVEADSTMEAVMIGAQVLVVLLVCGMSGAIYTNVYIFPGRTRKLVTSGTEVEGELTAVRTLGANRRQFYELRYAYTTHFGPQLGKMQGMGPSPDDAVVGKKVVVLHGQDPRQSLIYDYCPFDAT